MPPPAARPIDSLTGLRFVAALLVGLSHLHGWYLKDVPGLPRGVHRLLEQGHLGVPFFFVLSGFVLAYSYRDRARRPGGVRYGPYLLARAARIYPAHLLAFAAAVAFPFVPGVVEHPWAKAAAQALLVQGYVPDVGYQAVYNAVAWTLSVELFFYLTLPGLLWAVDRPRFGPVRLAAVAAGGLAVQAGVAVWLGRSPTGVTLWLTHLFPPLRVAEFAAGVLLGLAFLRVGAHTWADRPAQWWLRVAGTAAELAAVALVLAFVNNAGKASWALVGSCYYTPALASVVVVFAARVGWLSRLLCLRLPVFLGEISYSFYLFHCLVFYHLFDAVGGPDGSGLGRGGLAAASVAVTTALSAVVYLLWERPMRAVIVGRVKKSPALDLRPRGEDGRNGRFRLPLPFPGRKAG